MDKIKFINEEIERINDKRKQRNKYVSQLKALNDIKRYVNTMICKQ